MTKIFFLLCLCCGFWLFEDFESWEWLRKEYCGSCRHMEEDGVKESTRLLGGDMSSKSEDFLMISREKLCVLEEVNEQEG